MRPGKSIACVCLTLLLHLFCGAQVGLSGEGIIYSTDKETDLLSALPDSGLFVIKDIEIKGASRTRPATIYRELSFQQGESYPLPVIVEKFGETKKQLMNTGLFRNVVVSLRSLEDYNVYVQIEVEERWYIYPLPFVRFVDYNFQRWWTDGQRRMDRINYGIKVTQKNFTGRNDRLYVYFMNGYTKQIALKYDNLFLDHDMKWSASMSLAMGKNREVNYMTLGNKLVATKQPDRYIHSFVRSNLDVTYRRAIKTKHIFGLAYYHEDVADTVFKLNPYFSGTHKPISYPELSYTMSHFDLDFIPYPTKGYAAVVSLRKRGFIGPVNLWQLTASGSGLWPVSKNAFFNLRMSGILKLPLRQPYITQQFLGHNDMFMQGYENYIIDGVAGGYAKAMITRSLFKRTFHIPSERIKRINNIPFQVLAKAYVNAGYSYNPQPGDNHLTNRMLYSGGFGLDIVTFTDFVIKLEWSFNCLGQNGLYLHRRDYF